MESTSIIDTMEKIQSPVQAPRICYFCEPKGSDFNTARRIITIVFSYDKDGNVKYASSIFRRENKTEPFFKKNLRETAEKRFTLSPVEFEIKSSENTYNDVIQQIRKKMYKYGVKNKNTISEIKEADRNKVYIVRNKQMQKFNLSEIAESIN
jgi:hypothetical protein